MPTIEVTKEQEKVFTCLAKEEGICVGDFLLKCVKTIQLFFKEWEKTVEEKPTEEEKKPKYQIIFDGVTYTAKSCRQLYINLVTGIGPRRLFAAYAGNSTVLKAAFGRNDNKELYQKMEDGKHIFYLYVCISETALWRRIEEFAQTLKVTWEKQIGNEEIKETLLSK